ncbi:PA14 domain-containing protein [Cellulophaga sp. F20128]|uniref:PA14 domain-containing protein n=1 Tax=Cellulophaga sp. F20128 TaxID=2926413 RepID=UPI001FF18A99|nr:PA14 domain-containing protein [Cellulophaga sp. F20128]MCK0156799.1 PA14 domain-containing protein [Cellulophaga sp. F20128]
MKLPSLNQLSIAILFVLIFNACSTPITYDRPIDSWVFRSVLDKQPRMLTVALHKDLYVSYNLQLGNLYKVWKGGVNYEGAVYTTAHGIQPTSFGYTYAQDSTTATQWSLKTTAGLEVPQINYLGYSLIDNQVGIDFELIAKSGASVQIREIPEFEVLDNYSGLQRSFKVMKRTSQDLVPVLKYTIKDQFVHKEIINGLEQEIHTNEVSLSKKTQIKTYFNPIPDDWRGPVLDLSGKIAKGLNLTTQNDCSACHLKHENLVGPAYDSIASRYPFNWPTIELLKSKVILGGTGNWGTVPMTSHPDISEEEASNMAYYILSLDGEPEPEAIAVDLFVDTPAIPIELDAINRTTENVSTKEQGVAVNFYLTNDSGDLYDKLTGSTAPIFNGVAPAIHQPNAANVSEVRENFYMEFIGYIKSDEAVEKHFRLVSDDGSILLLNSKKIIDNTGSHAPMPVVGVGQLQKGWNSFKVQFHQGGGGASISLQWSGDGKEFTVVPETVFYHDNKPFTDLLPYESKVANGTPGDKMPLDAVHPSFDMYQAKPADFNPRIGGIDFIDSEKMIICTWDATGAVYIIKNYNTTDPSTIEVKQIAQGLAEPLGIKIVDGDIYVLQKQELTRLVDTDGDEIIDEYQKVCDAWHVTSHYHEFAFGLVYKDNSFYATLATDLGSEFKNVPDRGKVVRISKDGSEVEVIAEGFRTPNGIGEGPDGALYVSDNQGNWIPTSKVVRVEKGKWYGFRHADWDRVKDYEEQPPLVWLPHVEISNSPSQPTTLNLGPYKDQLIFGDVTHGGIKRVFIDEVDGVKQGAAFRFIQGLDAGINRTVWGPDGNLYAGGIGSGGNWRHEGKEWYALHRFDYNEKSTFEMLAVRAKSNGMEIEFTEPIDTSTTINSDNFTIEQYYYEATENYGGPKKGVETLTIDAVELSDDRKKIILTSNGLKEGKVVYIHIRKPFVSASKQKLWSTEVWYTMTKKPKR